MDMRGGAGRGSAAVEGGLKLKKIIMRSGTD